MTTRRLLREIWRNRPPQAVLLLIIMALFWANMFGVIYVLVMALSK